ncbi:UNVERIFIED_CONTAM: hypothetical protein K2H54_012177 [Gekko kuhli]
MEEAGPRAAPGLHYQQKTFCLSAIHAWHSTHLHFPASYFPVCITSNEHTATDQSHGRNADRQCFNFSSSPSWPGLWSPDIRPARLRKFWCSWIWAICILCKPRTPAPGPWIASCQLVSGSSHGPARCTWPAISPAPSLSSARLCPTTGLRCSWSVQLPSCGWSFKASSDAERITWTGNYWDADFPA